MEAEPEKKLPLLGHLRELRSALIRCFFVIIAATTACLYFSKDIFHFLQRPMLAVMAKDSSFIATGPVEAFVTYLKLSLLSGLFLSAPFVFYEIWRFVAPGLLKNEKKITAVFVTLATVFFVGGAFFGYFVIFPVGFKFFVAALSGTQILFLPQMNTYLGFISRMLLIFGLVFEMPLVLVFLARVGLVRHAGLARARRYVIVGMVLLAGILTPGPDVFSQVLLAAPLFILYEISVLAVKILERRTLTQPEPLTENP